MVQHLIEEHQWDIQLFLIEDLQTGLHIVPQLLLFHWDVVLHPQTNSMKMDIKLLKTLGANSQYFSINNKAVISQHDQPV